MRSIHLLIICLSFFYTALNSWGAQFEFQGMLDESVYQELKGNFLSELRLATEMIEAGRPEKGNMIIDLMGDSLGARSGYEVGDILVSINGFQSNQRDRLPLDLDEYRHVFFDTSERKLKEKVLPSSLLGVRTVADWNESPAFYYLRHYYGEPGFSEDWACGLLSLFKNPDFTESAFQRAQQSGPSRTYPLQEEIVPILIFMKGDWNVLRTYLSKNPPAAFGSQKIWRGAYEPIKQYLSLGNYQTLLDYVREMKESNPKGHTYIINTLSKLTRPSIVDDPPREVSLAALRNRIDEDVFDWLEPPVPSVSEEVIDNIRETRSINMSLNKAGIAKHSFWFPAGAGEYYVRFKLQYEPKWHNGPYNSPSLYASINVLRESEEFHKRDFIRGPGAGFTFHSLGHVGETVSFRDGISFTESISIPARELGDLSKSPVLVECFYLGNHTILFFNGRCYFIRGNYYVRQKMTNAGMYIWFQFHSGIFTISDMAVHRLKPASAK